MEIPINCPICQGVMLTEFNGAYILIKSCLKNISHGIKFIGIDKSADVLDIELKLSSNPEVWAMWDLVEESLCVRIMNPPRLPTPKLFAPHPYSKDVKLPYFYPEVSDCRKLIEKIQTYVLFS